MAAEQVEISDRLAFEVNGERFEVDEIDPSTTLLEFLRNQTTFKSVKLGCGEGGCGACVVLLSKYDPVLKRVESANVNSCLTLVCSINGCSITTSEGLGNSQDGFHPIHQRFAGFHASQCGFCTPGMCMSFFSALANAEESNRPEPPPGFSKLTVSEAERAISGNLCRCTGYRPIADACKSFAGDVDLEDLGTNYFWKEGDTRDVSRLPAYNPEDNTFPYTEVLEDEYKTTRLLDSEKLSWYTPRTIEDLQTLLASDPVGSSTRIKLVVGNTGTGYFRETEKYEKYIDIRYIPELSEVRMNDSGIELGATLPISKCIFYLREQSEASGGDFVFTKIADHMEKVASNFIRNSASLGGNLVMAQQRNFPSDIATLLLAVSSGISLLADHEYETITMEEFLARPPLDNKTVLLSVHIPSMEQKGNDGSVETSSTLVFDSYRAAPRPLGNALPYLNAAFLADISCHENGIVMNNVQLAFGAYGTQHATRASIVEEYLAGKTLSVEVFDEAVQLVKGAVVPEDGTSHADYRSSLAVAYLFEFLNNVVTVGSTLPGCSSEEGAVKINDGGNIASEEDLPLLSSGKQVLEYSQEYYPVGEPIPKYGAAMQASGEAVYVDDIPSPPHCLHGAFIYSTRASARVRGISFNYNSQPTEITAVISDKDIKGENVGVMSMFGPAPLFPGEVVRYAGDRIAFVVAETQKKANVVAETALVDYDTEGLDPPILTVEDAVNRSSFVDVPPPLYPAGVGDFAEGMAEADQTILSAEIKLGSQYFFYMETQSALAIPDEDNSMVVYSATQFPEFTGRVIAGCLGVPDNNVRVITRRCGGGFGGKIFKSMPLAAACALAAHKLRRPVRIYEDRRNDMAMIGGRHPMEITYSVGFKSNGKITALHVDILINAGIAEDISPMMPSWIVGKLKKYNWGALSFDIKVCKTNLSGKTSMRAPGDLQGSYIAEAIIEHVASFLSAEVDSIRTMNLHTPESLRMFYGGASGEPTEYTLPFIWDEVARLSTLLQRVEMIEEFNRSNLWRKRGISRVPIVHNVSVRTETGKVSILWDGSIVVEVGGIEIGQGLWTKVQQVTAYALGLLQFDGNEELWEKVRVVQSDTLSLIQGGPTAGSTTSESSCEAARLCCNVLVERLAPLLEMLREEMGSVSWEELILQANNQNVYLSATSFFIPDSASVEYLIYGAAVSEVEVDILTGLTTVLRTDIVYDCGQSLNPATDLGQIEGAFVQGVGFFVLEEYLTNSEGLMVTNSTWTYHIPTIDTIPRQLNVEVLNSGHHPDRILSSKASGEPPLHLAASVHCAIRAAIRAAREQLKSWGAGEGTDLYFELDVPATMPIVKQYCGLHVVETYLQYLLSQS